MKFKEFIHSFWGGVIIIVLILIIGYLVWGALVKGEVIFSLVGPDEVKSGEISKFSFKYNNKSRSNLEDCFLEVRLPEGVFQTEDPLKQVITFDLGEVKSQAAGEESLELMITGEPQTAKNIEATFTYRPKGISSPFYKSAIKTVLLSGSSFNLGLTAPQKVFIGQTFPLEINWSNLVTKSFEGVEIRAEWPSGFSLVSSNPSVSKESGSNNQWLIGVVNPVGQGTINVQASLEGQDGETKMISLALGIVQNNQFLPLANVQAFITLVANPLRLSVLVNGDTNYNADLGEELDFTINYENNYSSSLRDLQLVAHLKGDVFDFSSIRAPKALLNTRLQTLTWTGDKVSSLYVLNPGEKGTLNFSLKLKSDWPMVSLAQKNIILEVDTTLKSANIPEELEYQIVPQASNLVTIKLNSNCNLVIGSYFRDPPALIANSGNLPLKVNQPTDFTIHWKIINTYNSLNNVKVVTTLPLWAEWTNQVAGNYGEEAPQYDARTRQVSWSLPVVPVGSGYLSNPYEAIFQIKVTPLSSQANQSIELTNETIFTAIDSFTLKEIKKTYLPLKSDSLTDKTVISNEGIVRP